MCQFGMSEKVGKMSGAFLLPKVLQCIIMITFSSNASAFPKNLKNALNKTYIIHSDMIKRGIKSIINSSSAGFFLRIIIICSTSVREIGSSASRSVLRSLSTLRAMTARSAVRVCGTVCSIWP